MRKVSNEKERILISLSPFFRLQCDAGRLENSPEYMYDYVNFSPII